jgi:hypothetical protein
MKKLTMGLADLFIGVGNRLPLLRARVVLQRE